MHRQTLVIAPKDDAAGATRRRRTAAKSRRFKAELIAYVEADGLWKGGEASTQHIRPVWLMVAGTDQEMPAFAANLRAGRKAELVKDHANSSSSATCLELLRSAGYRYTWQYLSLDNLRCAVLTAYLPELCQFDPGLVDPALVAFVMLPPRWWVEEQRATLVADTALCAELLAHADRLGLTHTTRWGHVFNPDEVLALAPVATLFAGYLDRRTSKPLPPDAAFALHLYLHALRAGVAGLSRPSDTRRLPADEPWAWARALPTAYEEAWTEQAGLLPGLACLVTRTDLDTFLAQQVQAYVALCAGDASTPARAGSAAGRDVQLTAGSDALFTSQQEDTHESTGRP